MSGLIDTSAMSSLNERNSSDIATDLLTISKVLPFMTPVLSIIGNSGITQSSVVHNLNLSPFAAPLLSIIGNEG